MTHLYAVHTCVERSELANRQIQRIQIQVHQTFLQILESKMVRDMECAKFLTYICFGVMNLIVAVFGLIVAAVFSEKEPDLLYYTTMLLFLFLVFLMFFSSLFGFVSHFADEPRMFLTVKKFLSLTPFFDSDH